jgi:hypothetical protein
MKTKVALAVGMLVGASPFAVEKCWNDAPPPLPPERVEEIKRQPAVELWGFQAERWNPIAEKGFPRPYVMVPTDAGLVATYPSNISEDPESGWQRYAIILSVWAKGDPAAVNRLLDRWAEEGYRAVTHNDLKR